MGSECEYRYRVVDVFTEHPLEGNALAVFTDAAAMDTTTMQRVARELNLAETAFVLPATREDCAARVRIFTPSKEMLFAGHPTIGTAFVLLDEGLTSAKTGGFNLEEQIGAVAVRIESGKRTMLWLSTPPIESLVSSTSGTRFVSEQGSKMGRRSVLHVHVRGNYGVEGIEIGGHVTPLTTASMRFRF